MPRTRTPEAPPPIPFQRPLRVAQLDRAAAEAIALRPEETERAAIARFLGVDAVERMALTGTLEPAGTSGWLFRGQLTARVVQPCVVTLEPVRQSVDVPVRQAYEPAPPMRQTHPAELELSAEDLDAPEPFEDVIDLGHLAVEELGLAVDPFPRAPGAELDLPGQTDDPAERPFAALEALKGRLGS